MGDAYMQFTPRTWLKVMDWTSLHCFVTLHQDADYADAFLESLTEKLAGILLFVAINEKLFTLLEADSN
jgi:hypothetical protein